MRAETLLRKLCLQEALSEDEFNSYRDKLRPDGSLPAEEIPLLLELLKQRTEHLSIEDIKAVSSLAGQDRSSTDKAGKIDEDQALRAIASKLGK